MLTKPVMADLANYLGQLRRLPILEAKDEARLIKRWREDFDRAGAPTSHEPTAPCRHGRAFTQVHCVYRKAKRERSGNEVRPGRRVK
jgi:hypothetical protein